MSQLLTPQQTAEILGLSKQTLANWRCRQPDLLPWIELSPRRIRYKLSDVEAFIEKRRRGGVR